MEISLKPQGLTAAQLESLCRQRLPKNRHALQVVESNGEFTLVIVVTPARSQVTGYKPTLAEIKAALGDYVNA